MQHHKYIRLKSLHELRTCLPHEQHAINGDLRFARYLATVFTFFYVELHNSWLCTDTWSVVRKESSLRAIGHALLAAISTVWIT